jgi:agmatinase
MAKEIRGDRGAFLRSPRASAWEAAYSGVPSFVRRPYTRDLEGVDVAVLGVPFDLATTHRPGARFGPRAIREASTDLAWGALFPWGFDPFERLAVTDFGDVRFESGDAQNLVEALQADVGSILSAGAETLCLGGDHFISLPILREQARVHGPLALVHFDAHTDTEPTSGKYDHGTMFRHAVEEGLVDPDRSVQIGIRTYYKREGHRFAVLDSPWVHANGTDATSSRIEEVVGAHKAYLSFDIDCLDPAFAPGTGTPSAGGLSSAQALAILRGLNQLHFVGMDVVEVAPPYDAANITALAAATLAVDFLCLKSCKLPVGAG